MSAPLIFITTASIKEGRLDDFKQFTEKLVANFEAREPEIVAFNVFLDEAETFSRSSTSRSMAPPARPS
jgi:hypothetical protein